MFKNVFKVAGIVAGEALVGSVVYLGSVELVELGFEAARKGLDKMRERELRKEAEREAEREQLKEQLKKEILAEMQAEKETVEA